MRHEPSPVEVISKDIPSLLLHIIYLLVNNRLWVLLLLEPGIINTLYLLFCSLKMDVFPLSTLYFRDEFAFLTLLSKEFFLIVLDLLKNLDPKNGICLSKGKIVTILKFYILGT